MKPAPVPVLPVEIAAAAARGWRALPVEARGKLPLIKRWPEAATSHVAQLEAWAVQFPGCNWGLATGTGLVVIDVDGEAGRESLANLEQQGLTLPATLTVTTGRADGGTHLYYRMPSGVDIHNDQSGRIGPHIDVRSKGGFVVCPPSIHASGKQYCFIDPSAPLTDLPAWIVQRLTSPPSISTTQTGPQAVSKGNRTKRMVSLAGTLQKRGVAPATIEAALLAENETQCDPPLPKSKVVSIARDIPHRYPASESTGPTVDAPTVDALPPMTPEDAARKTGELLDQCRAWIRRFVILGEPEVMILACWLLHTWAFVAAVVTPYIHIHSAEKSSGKTTLMLVLKTLARAARFSSSMSASAMARVVAKFTATLFLDELDAQMKGDREKAQEIRGVLDGGFDASGTYTRCVGKDFDVVDFPTFCPKALSGIGELWDTVESRSIGIEMRRRLPTEKVEGFRQRRVGKDATPIAQALQEWSNGGVVGLLNQIEVADVPGLNDRQMDISEPLLQIAQLAGDEWLQRLTTALEIIFIAPGKADDSSTGANLLADIRAVFDERRVDTVMSKDMAACLCEIEGRPWAEWSRGKGLSPNNLARQLKRFALFPQTIRAGAETAKGYRRKDFEEAWSRYCPLPVISSVTTSQPASVLAETTFAKRNTHPAVTVAKSEPKPHEQRAVTGVTVGIGVRAEKGGLLV